MATKDTGGQKRATKHDDEHDEVDTSRDRGRPGAPRQADRRRRPLLDEIDGVLEENAEEFVRAYVQKGGE